MKYEHLMIMMLIKIKIIVDNVHIVMVDKF